MQEPTTPELEETSSLSSPGRRRGRKRRSSLATTGESTIDSSRSGDQVMESMCSSQEEARPSTSLFAARVGQSNSNREVSTECLPQHVLHNFSHDNDTRTHSDGGVVVDSVERFCASSSDIHFNALANVLCSPLLPRPLTPPPEEPFSDTSSPSYSMPLLNNNLPRVSYCHQLDGNTMSVNTDSKFSSADEDSRSVEYNKAGVDNNDGDFEALSSLPQAELDTIIYNEGSHTTTQNPAPRSPFDELKDFCFDDETAEDASIGDPWSENTVPSSQEVFQSPHLGANLSNTQLANCSYSSQHDLPETCSITHHYSQGGLTTFTAQSHDSHRTDSATEQCSDKPLRQIDFDLLSAESSPFLSLAGELYQLTGYTVSSLLSAESSPFLSLAGELYQLTGYTVSSLFYSIKPCSFFKQIIRFKKMTFQIYIRDQLLMMMMITPLMEILILHTSVSSNLPHCEFNCLIEHET